VGSAGRWPATTWSPGTPFAAHPVGVDLGRHASKAPTKVGIYQSSASVPSAIVHLAGADLGQPNGG